MTNSDPGALGKIFVLHSLQSMLKSLHIQNLALIDDLTLEFGEGLNLLTGETGSGKSIIVDSMGLILGKRAGSDVIRAGADSAKVEAVVELNARVRQFLCCSGIEAGDDWAVFRREISRSGRGRAWINHSAVTLGFLQELGLSLADIHGQQDQQLLQQPNLHIDLLDDFAENSVERAQVEDAYDRMTKLQKQMHAAEIAEHERHQRIEFLQFQIREIEEARLQPDEEEGLLRERNLLTHGEELARLSGEIYQWLYNQDESALGLLSRSMRNLQKLAAIDPELQALEASARNAQFLLEDLSHRMRDYFEAIDFDPARLEQVELRLDRIERLKKKYLGSVSEILKLLPKLKEEQAQLANWEENRLRIADQYATAVKEYQDVAARLSEKRQKAAAAMQKAMETELRSLAMERSRFIVSTQLSEPTRKGIDRIEFLISPNVGEEPRPLAKIASGGELSRLMLALETTLHASGRELMVFDEVDSGIGGRVAETIGLKLKRLASRHQVFCVTHLPQIAAFGDIHFRVGKEVRKGRTFIVVERLDAHSKLQEVARMLAGARIGKSALDHARELISRSSTSRS
ncbi:MAG: DNA repair protein RecN [Acidobacteria bacterium]|nr:DNA repair protein RecN [Acidobacteriota bacterium]